MYQLTHHRLLNLSVAVVILATVGAQDACAQTTIPITDAPYRLVFVTSGTRDATSSDIADYNSFVNTQAGSLVPTTTWTAIASTPTVDARDNTSTNTSTDGTGVPIYNLNGQLVANDYADLWDGTINAAINYTQDGTVRPGTLVSVWTGSETDGTEKQLLGAGRGLGNSNGTYSYLGIYTATDGNWISTGSLVLDQVRPLYAMSGILINGVDEASIPEPGSLGLGLVMAMAAGGWCVVRRKRKPAASTAPSHS